MKSLQELKSDVSEFERKVAYWKAAGERHKDGDIYRSIDINTERFQIPYALRAILIRTADEMGWKK